MFWSIIAFQHCGVVGIAYHGYAMGKVSLKDSDEKYLWIKGLQLCVQPRREPRVLFLTEWTNCMFPQYLLKIIQKSLGDITRKWNIYHFRKMLGCLMRYCNYFDGLAQDCSISIINALEILQSCTKPAICTSNTRNCPYNTVWWHLCRTHGSGSQPSGMCVGCVQWCTGVGASEPRFYTVRCVWVQ